MTTSAKPPEFIAFSAMPVIEATASEKELPRFSMVAYSGGRMRVAGFPHPVVVDLAGLDVPDQSVPIRLDHKSNQGVGHTTRIEAHEGRLIAEGLISRDTSWARDVARSGSNGFPWRASIGGPVIEAEFVPPGQTVEVNGQTFEGPLHVVRRMTLKEISFVDSGADGGAKAVVATQAKENDLMPKTTDVTDDGNAKDHVEAQDNAKAADDAKATDGGEVAKTPEKLEASADVIPHDTDSALTALRTDLRRAAAEETRRIAEIRKICAGEYPQIEAQAIDGLTKAEVAFGEQTKPNGRPLGVPARILLVPTALKVPAELLMVSINLNETTATGKPKPQTNPHVGKFDVVSSVYLSNTAFAGNSSKAWYLMADPNRLPTLEVAFLGGVDRPTVERADADFNTLGIQFRGYIDFGVREQDHRGALKMKGEV